MKSIYIVSFVSLLMFAAAPCSAQKGPAPSLNGIEPSALDISGDGAEVGSAAFRNESLKKSSRQNPRTPSQARSGNLLDLPSARGGLVA